MKFGNLILSLPRTRELVKLDTSRLMHEVCTIFLGIDYFATALVASLYDE